MAVETFLLPKEKAETKVITIDQYFYQHSAVMVIFSFRAAKIIISLRFHLILAVTGLIMGYKL